MTTDMIAVRRTLAIVSKPRAVSCSDQPVAGEPVTITAVEWATVQSALVTLTRQVERLESRLRAKEAE